MKQKTVRPKKMNSTDSNLIFNLMYNLVNFDMLKRLSKRGKISEGDYMKITIN